MSSKLIAGVSCVFVATMSISGCATPYNKLSPKALQSFAQDTSCTAPYILKIEDADIRQLQSADIGRGALSDRDAKDIYIGAKLARLGFEDVTPLKDNSCENNQVMAYRLAGLSEQGNSGADLYRHPLYVRPMSAAQIKADPNVTCEPTFTQVYQPPLSFGGSGRVMNIPNGEKCVGRGEAK